MRNKGLLTILIASVFSLVVIFSLITMLSVKHIDVDFSVYNLGEEYTDDIYNELNEYKGKNITFLDLDDLRSDLSKYTYFEVVSIKKSFPNVIKVVLKERFAKYVVIYNDAKYLISSDGFVLEEYNLSATLQGYMQIDASLVAGNEFILKQPIVGEYLSANFDDVLSKIIAVAEDFSLSDFVTKAEVFSYKSHSGTYGDMSRLVLYTKTGVEIHLNNFINKTADKVSMAITSYNNAGDYIKANRFIEVSELQDGTLHVESTENDPW